MTLVFRKYRPNVNHIMLSEYRNSQFTPLSFIVSAVVFKEIIHTDKNWNKQTWAQCLAHLIYQKSCNPEFTLLHFFVSDIMLK